MNPYSNALRHLVGTQRHRWLRANGFNATLANELSKPIETSTADSQEQNTGGLASVPAVGVQQAQK